MKLSESLVVRKSAQLVARTLQNLTSIAGYNWFSWWGGGHIHEPYPGAWQQNVTLDPQPSLLAFSAVFSCVTGIASDVAKMRIKLDRINEDGIWTEITENQPWLPVLRRPNHYQTRIQFVEQWIVSKLLHGNAYIFKERQDKRGIVTALYVLDPQRVTVLVADDGSVYYQIRQDYLNQVEEDVTLPASEIIHDRMTPLWHPLIGVSPLYASGASATMGNRIQSNSTNLFGNLSRPGGVVMFPLKITDEQAASFKARWESGFGGANIGKTAILDNGSKFEPIGIPAEASQLIEQLRFTVEDIARAFHYPQYKLGGPMPPYSSGPQTLSLMYFTDCLQPLIENLEECLDHGLELPMGMGTELDLDNLLRMDTASLYDSNGKAVGAGWMSPDEARFKANYPPVEGGDSPMIQQQNYSLAALAKRDATDDPFGTENPSAPAPPPAPEPPALPPAKDPEGKSTLTVSERRVMYRGTIREFVST